MNLQETQDKLQESQFFLGHLQHAQGEQHSTNPSAFLYYLSAFLSASDSVQNYVETEVIRTLRRDAIAKGKKASRHFKESLKGWASRLSSDDQGFWRAMRKQRGKEVHVERTKTLVKQKELLMELLPHGYSEKARAFAAYYVMQQHVAPFYYEQMTEAERQALRPPSGGNVIRYVQEHHVEIEGFSGAVVTICERYVRLLADFVQYFKELKFEANKSVRRRAER